MIWKRTRHSHRRKQDPLEKAKQLADLEMLEWSAAAGEIDLLYLDESGLCLWMPAEYSYYFQGEQKRMEQTKRRELKALSRKLKVEFTKRILDGFLRVNLLS